MSLERIGVEELAPPELFSVRTARFGDVAYLGPVGVDCGDLPIDDLVGLLGRQVVVVSMGDTARNLAQAVPVGPEGHRLGGLSARTGLWADVVRRRERQVRAVPEGRVVAAVVVGVAHQDVEDDAREQFPQRRISGGEARPDLVG